MDAAIMTFSSMFPLKYYGGSQSQISVNSNGFLTMGYSDYLYGDNSPIPDAHGPVRMIAPFWDDLDPSAGGDIYRWLDTTNHRWIIQFDEVRHWGSTDTETFQVIVLNQSWYPTPTGDTPILIQYQDVTDPSSCTVGIENADQDDGVGWAYDGTYGSQALPIADETAILFTTVPPGEPAIPWLVLAGMTVDDSSGGNGDGLAQPGETVALVLDVENQGGRDALGVSVSLSTDESVVAIVDGTAALPDIPIGGSDQNSDPLVLSVSEAIDDTVATVWAAFEANGGTYAATARIDLHIDLTGTGIDDQIPSAFHLSPCHPNPFARGTTMRLALPAPSPVTVRIYNPSGRLVRTLVDAPLAAGEHPLVWDGADGAGRRVASGVYFVRVEAGRDRASRKVVLLM